VSGIAEFSIAAVSVETSNAISVWKLKSIAAFELPEEL